MNIILSKKDDFQIDQYADVTNIAFDKQTKIYTITYGPLNTVTYYDGNEWVLTVLLS